MTRTINREFYAKLLAKYQPKVIETEEENEAAIALAEDCLLYTSPSPRDS